MRSSLHMAENQQSAPGQYTLPYMWQRISNQLLIDALFPIHGRHTQQSGPDQCAPPYTWQRNSSQLLINTLLPVHGIETAISS